MNDDDDFDVASCPECGEEDNLAYVETNASGMVYECRACGDVFQTVSDEEEEDEDDDD